MPNWKKVITSGSSAQLNSLSINGTSIDPTGATQNQILMYNGTNFVAVDEGSTFVFSITNFSDGESTTQVAGTAGATWKAADTITFTATYNAGPPTTAEIKEMTTPTVVDNWGTPFGTDTNTSIITYPNPGSTRQFRLTADGEIDNETAITFKNYIFYGASTQAGSYDETFIEALTSTQSEDKTQNNKSITATGTKYIFWIYPNRLGSMSNYFTWGTSTSNQIAMEFSLIGSGYGVINSAGLDEDYKIYRSDVTVDESGYLDTGVSIINYIYYGELNVDSAGNGANTYTQANVKDNVASAISSQGGLVSNTLSSTELVVNCAAGQYGYFAYPSRLGAVTSIVVGGFESINDFDVDANSGNELDITNEYGYEEEYYVYVSQAHSLTDPTTFVVTI